MNDGRLKEDVITGALRLVSQQEEAAAPWTGHVCPCGALLRVADRLSSQPNLCAECRRKATREEFDDEQ